MTNTANQITFQIGDRVTDGDEITGHVVKVNSKRATVAYWGAGRAEGRLVRSALALSSLTLVRAATDY